MPRSWGSFAAGLLLALAPLAAQTPKDVPTREKEVDQKVVQLLVAFARSAESYKAPSRARAVFEQILDHYDIDNAPARTGLGYKRVKEEWRQSTPADKLPADTATAANLKLLTDAWAQTRQKVAKLHRELGTALLAEGVESRGRFQLERSLAFEPDDAATHRALGHAEIDGFFGTTEEIAFVTRMREITAKASEIAGKDFEVKDLPDTSMPSELKKSGLQFFGARSNSFTHWVIGSPEAAIASVVWAERSAALLDFLLPADGKQRLQRRSIQWLAILRTTEERDILLAASPGVMGKYTIEQARMFGGQTFQTVTGQAAYVYEAVENDADHSVAHVTKRCCARGGNAGLGEGLVHAMTWLLCGSTLTFYCSLPNTVTKDSAPRLERDPDDWLARLHDEIEAGKDWPLVQVPRERSDNFRDSVRVKSWSFMVWLLARYPDRWVKVFDPLTKDGLQTEDVEAAFQKIFESDVGTIEAEWREWARPGSRIGKAAGYGR